MSFSISLDKFDVYVLAPKTEMNHNGKVLVTLLTLQMMYCIAEKEHSSEPNYMYWS